jgi:hypothetical protein
MLAGILLATALWFIDQAMRSIELFVVRAAERSRHAAAA